MRIDGPEQKKAAFRETKEKHQKTKEYAGCLSDLDVSDDELANFVNKLPRETGKYKGKLPLKCFSCGKIGHFAAKCPLRKNRPNSRRNFLERKFVNKQTFFSQVEDGVSDYEEDDESVVEGRNKILFLAKEDPHNNDVSKKNEEGVVDIEP